MRVCGQCTGQVDGQTCINHNHQPSRSVRLTSLSRRLTAITYSFSEPSYTHTHTHTHTYVGYCIPRGVCIHARTGQYVLWGGQ